MYDERGKNRRNRNSELFLIIPKWVNYTNNINLMFGLTSSQRTFRKCPLYTWEWQNKYRHGPVVYSFKQPVMFPLTFWRYWTLFTHSGYGWEDIYCWHLRFTEQLSLKCPLFQTICIAWNNYRDCRLCLFPPWKKK